MSARALAVLALCQSGACEAATIYGSVFEDGTPAANKRMTLECSGQPQPQPTQTDGHGNYRLISARPGACDLTVDGATLRVIFYGNPVNYDFVLGNESGRRTLRQR